MDNVSISKGATAKSKLMQPTRAASQHRKGSPLLIDLALIDEDPMQPRSKNNPGFQPSSLADLAATIELRGVKTPISVRDNLQQAGRYIINHGARRYRASKLAGKSTIPAFIDNDYNDADQVIENIQRNELTAREIAEYIGRELAKGRKKGEIGRSIGKSAAFITQHVALLDLPGPIAEVFNSGRVRDVTVINELIMSFRASPEDTCAWLSDKTQEITRPTLKLLREFIDEKASLLKSTEPAVGDDFCPGTPVNVAAPPDELKADVSRIRSPFVKVMWEMRVGRLLLNRRPSVAGRAWIQLDDDGSDVEVGLCNVTLLELAEMSLSSPAAR